MTDQEFEHVLTVLRDLFNSVKPYAEHELTGRTRCKFCDRFQGWWLQEDKVDWVPTHTEKCIIGRAIAILQKYPEREGK